jgi:ABC-type transport system involved in multi-copper enzyme maturation permease subunit
MSVSAWIGIGLAIAILAILAILRLRASAPWLGPLFRHELVRLARRGAQPRLRAVYAGLLLVGLLVIYLRVFSNTDPVALLFDTSLQLPQDEKSTFTEWFTYVYFLVQLIAVSLITPVYAGGAIAEEKDRKSLDFLQSSLLTNREIILGKLAARLTFVTCIVLVGLPVLFMTMLFGGLDETTIIAGFLISLFTMLGLAGFSLLMGVYRNSLKDALFWPYGVLIVTTVLGVVCSCCFPWFSVVSPFTALTWIYFMNANAGMIGGIWGLSGSEFTIVVVSIYCTIYGLVFLICTTIAILGIRPVNVRSRIDPDERSHRTLKQSSRIKNVSVERSAPPERPHGVGDPYDLNPPPPAVIRRPRTVRARRSFTVPPLRDGDPFLWKERYFSGRLPMMESGVAWGCAIAVIVVFLSIIGISLVAGVLVKVLEGQLPGEVVNGCMRVFVVGTVIGLAPVIGLRAASSIAKERQQQTLLSLLGVPEARSRILFAKWLAPLFSVRYWLAAIVIFVMLSLVTGGLHPLGVFAGMVYLIGFLPFANSYGMWLSVRCRTGTRASAIFIGTMLALLIGPPIFGTLFRAIIQVLADSTTGSFAEHFLDNVNPVVGIWQAFAGWREVGGLPGDGAMLSPNSQSLTLLATVTMIGIMYLLAAVWFGWRAKENFERETA